MHEAGLWARSLYPSLRSALAASRRRRADPVGGPRHRDPAHGRPPPRRRATDRSPTSSTTTSWPPSRRPADPRRPGDKRLTHEDLSSADHRGRARAAPARRCAAPREPSPSATRSPTASRSIPRWVSFLDRQAGPGRPGDAALGALARPAAVGRVHGRQPRLRPARRLPDRGRGGPGRCRTAAPLHVRIGSAA